MTDLAFGRPGIPPGWTSSEKDGVGTAYSAASRVWFTLSHGILNEIYYPTIDRPQVRDMEFLITDGETFFHEEKRDLECAVEGLDHNALGYRIASSDRQKRYRLIKEVISDPHQPCVLIHVRVEGDDEMLKRLQIYALLAPHLEGGGWGNSASRLTVVGKNALLAWKGKTHLAMGANLGFSRTSCGYVGFSDGWQDLREDFRLDWQFDRAEDGNVALTGQIDLGQGREFTVGIAFGDSHHAAISILTQSLGIAFAEHRARFVEQWQRASRTQQLGGYAGDEGRLYHLSHNLLLAHEDKTFAGAMIASASIPWGQIKGDEDLGGYHLVWTRDMVQSANGLLASGNTGTPHRALVYLACSQHEDGSFSQNFWIDGEPYWRGIQLDEVSFPIILAWRLWKEDALGEFDPYPMVKSAAGFLVNQGPITQQERWEEASGYSPSTLAATIAGLICAADFTRSRGDVAAASFLEDYADFLESHLEAWTVTTQGSLVPGISRHYIRILPVAIGDYTPEEDPNSGLVALANRPPGEPWQFPAKDIVDAGFLELVRYGIRKPGDPLMEDSLRVVDALLKVDTPFGPCWRRYNHDGYGQRPDGSPYQWWGKGRAWPLLTGERGHYELAAGRDPWPYLRAMERFASKGGMLPEQVWDEADRRELGLFCGRSAGSAMPLAWAHAEYIKLLRSVADGQVYNLIPIVADRYLRGRGRKDLEIWKLIRKVRSVEAGSTLRVQAAERFRLVWSRDAWQTVEVTDSTSVSLRTEFVDIPVPQSQQAPIEFTFYWSRSQRWEGRNYQVALRRQEARSMPIEIVRARASA